MANPWDFDSGTIWYERIACSEYPTFIGCGGSGQIIDLSNSCAVVGVVTASILNLDHLEGQEVAILADGLVLDRQTVTGGQITLPASYAKVHVGLPIEADIETINVNVNGKETLQGRFVKIGNIVFRLINSRGGFVGPDSDTLYEALPDAILDKFPDTPLTDMITGDIRIPLGAEYNIGGRIFYRQSDPLPVTIGCLIPEVSVGGAM